MSAPQAAPFHPSGSGSARLSVVLVVAGIIGVLPAAYVALTLPPMEFVEPPGPPPNILLDDPLTIGGGEWDIHVGASSSLETLERFQVQVFNETAVAIPAVGLDVVEEFGIEGGGFELSFIDIGGVLGEQRLSIGDVFRLSGLHPGFHYSLLIIWAQNGDVLALSDVFP